MVIYPLFVFMNMIFYVSAFTLNSCNYNDLTSCTENLRCMWCNTTIPNLYSSPNKTIISNSSCYKVPLCNTNQDIYNSCTFKNERIETLTCDLFNLLFIVMLIMGYYVSMIIIYGTVDKALTNENVSVKTRHSINTIIIILTFVPLVLTFIFHPLSFYFLFFTYLVCGICTACCVKIKTNKNPETLSILNPTINPSFK